jgi:hypothetical protein
MLSIQAKSVMTNPSPASPTVTQPRGNPRRRSRKAGNSVQTVASRNSRKAVLTVPSSNPLRL